jgi:hypothetical protein
LVESTFAKPDFADLFEQALKVVLAQKCAILHTLSVQHVAFDGEFPENLRGPLPELGGPHGVDAIADGDDRIEIEEIDVAGDLTLALGLNYSEFPNSCLALDFAGFIGVLQVFIDGGNRHLEQSRHQLL